jgi:hypothetical protein
MKRFANLEMAILAVIALSIAAVLTVSGTTLVGGTQSASDAQEQAASSQEVVATTTIPLMPVAADGDVTADSTTPQTTKATGNISPTIIIVSPESTPIETTTTTMNMADYCRMPDFVSLGLLKAPFLGFDLWLNSGMREACDSGGFGAGLGSRVVTGCADESMASLVQTDNANSQAFMRFVDQSPQAGTLIPRFNASSAFHVTVHLWQSDWTLNPESIVVSRC